MFVFVIAHAEYQDVSSSEKHPEIDARLRRRLVGGARAAGAGSESEDVAHDAVVRLLKETVGPKSPPIEARALTALRRVLIERWRKSERRNKITKEDRVVEASDDPGEPVVNDVALEIVELSQDLRAVVGEDVMTMALLRTYCGMTENDIARELGWTAARAAAVRVRMGRNKPLISKLLKDFGSKGGST